MVSSSLRGSRIGGARIPNMSHCFSLKVLECIVPWSNDLGDFIWAFPVGAECSIGGVLGVQHDFPKHQVPNFKLPHFYSEIVVFSGSIPGQLVVAPLPVFFQ